MGNEKGISPLIATVLLVVIAVSIAGLMFSWLNTFTSNAQRKVDNKTLEAIDCSGASVRIRDVYLQNSTSATVRAIVENTGYVNNLTISGAQVYNKFGDNATANNTPITFSKGQIVTLNFTGVTILPQCANFSKLFVSTTCGGINDQFDGTPKGC